MMTLQAIWWTTSLHLWAADDNGHGDGAASSSSGLRERLGEISADALIAPSAAESRLTLWLPQTGNGNGAPASLAPRTVPTLALSAAQAIDFLLAVPDPLPAGCGDSIRYWQALAQHVVDRLARKQFIPDLEMGGPEQYQATWRIVAATESALQRLDQFATAMPPVCRAVVLPDRAPAPEPIDLVHSFMHAAADVAIRRAVSYDPFFSRPQALMNEPDASDDVRWMAALLNEQERTVPGDSYDNRHLYDQVRLWLSRLDQQRPDAPWKVWFILHEPEIEDHDGDVETVSSEAQWTVEFQLQSPSEEDKFIEAAELWADRASNIGGIFGRGIAHRRTQLVAELARAAEVFPPLERVAGVANPTELKLSTLEAHLLMRQWAPQLREKEFGVMLPNWSLQADRQLGLLLNVNPSALLGGAGGTPGGAGFGEDADSAIVTGNLGLETLLDFDWRVAVGEMKMTPEEFRQIAQLKSPLVRYRGQWMEIDTEAAHRAAEFLEKQQAGQMTLAQAFRTAFGLSKSRSGLPVLGLSGSSWIEPASRQA